MRINEGVESNRSEGVTRGNGRRLDNRLELEVMRGRKEEKSREEKRSLLRQGHEDGDSIN